MIQMSNFIYNKNKHELEALNVINWENSDVTKEK